MHSEDPASSEWATPVLFMRTWTGELFPAKNVWDSAVWKERARRLTLALLVFLLLVGAALAARTWRVERLVTEGAALYEHGEWSAAREHFQTALRLAPGSAEVLSDLAGSEEKLGDVQEAEEHYREAAWRQPDSAEHLYNLGHFLNSRKKYDEAYQVLSQAIARDPQRADAYGELAQAAGGRGMLAKACMILGVALRLDSERPALYRRLGELELKAGRPRAALTHLDEARRRYPLGDLERVETTWLSAQAYDQLGDVPSLCREIRELHRLDPTGVTPWVLKADEIAARRSCRQEP
jgi:Tfp pilus assembly protein PilF